MEQSQQKRRSFQNLRHEIISQLPRPSSYNENWSHLEKFPIDEIKNPAYTAEMEGMIHMIEKKEMPYGEFVENTNTFVKETVAKLGETEEKVADEMILNWNQQIEVCRCPCKRGKSFIKETSMGAVTILNVRSVCQRRLKKKRFPKPK